MREPLTAVARLVIQNCVRCAEKWAQKISKKCLSALLKQNRVTPMLSTDYFLRMLHFPYPRLAGRKFPEATIRLQNAPTAGMFAREKEISTT